MDERDIRTERVTDVRTDVRSDVDRDVDIRRTMIMGRDLGYEGDIRYQAVAPLNRAIHWGPIFAGLATTLVLSLLLGALFVGLGFESTAGVFGGLTGTEVGWGAAIALAIAVFAGSYFTGYASDLRSKSEAIINGFMVGVTSILTPVVLAVMGAGMAANVAATAAPGAVTNPDAAVTESAEAGLRNALVVAADNAWTVFGVGLLVLGIAALGGYLGRKSRESGIKHLAKHEHDLDRPHITTTY